ncbi:MAG: triose-phosphate isomerase [Candidatus Dormibacteraeota bacterium]|uniref:Triosephosphate isomerase n=1 Tax=Candidatus Amunia macphersoniae TaxID=3127014 RepID=A0A934KRH6_9BACT|nr:triose-phosphate isomerase [Candidatus Dormibacteraeota bacterium]
MVAGNWKMNTTVLEGIALARAVSELCTPGMVVEVAVFPPFPHLWPVRGALGVGPVLLGAQDVFWEDSGAYTGEVSASMLAGWCDLVLVGHSERRHLLGETDAETGRKFAAGLRHGLGVIVAVGETGDERDAGSTFTVIDRQLDAALSAVDEPPPTGAWLVAYEPVWAIGTGRTASPEQADEVCAHIRDHVAERTAADAPRVLYGGSVSADNAAELFSRASIDGGLIGGASLRPDQFARIVAAAANAAR